MVENRPWANFFAHLTLLIGVAVVVFPVYVALVASTQAPGDLLRGTLPMLPGAYGIENFTQMWQSGVSNAGAPPAGTMLWNSFIMAMAITGEAIYLIAVGFCDCLFPLPLSVVFLLKQLQIYFQKKNFFLYSL